MCLSDSMDVALSALHNVCSITRKCARKYCCNRFSVMLLLVNCAGLLLLVSVASMSNAVNTSLCTSSVAVDDEDADDCNSCLDAHRCMIDGNCSNAVA